MAVQSTYGVSRKRACSVNGAGVLKEKVRNAQGEVVLNKSFHTRSAVSDGADNDEHAK